MTDFYLGLKNSKWGIQYGSRFIKINHIGLAILNSCNAQNVFGNTYSHLICKIHTGLCYSSSLQLLQTIDIKFNSHYYHYYLWIISLKCKGWLVGDRGWKCSQLSKLLQLSHYHTSKEHLLVEHLHKVLLMHYFLNVPQ